MRFIMGLMGGFAAVFVFHFFLDITGTSSDDLGRMYWVYLFAFVTLGDYTGRAAYHNDSY